MRGLLITILIGLEVLLLLPVVVVFCEVMLAITGTTNSSRRHGERRPLAVLIPAHNESSMIAATLRSILPQLGDGDRLVVIADNCTDDTAKIASWEGAEVIVRENLNQRGKSFAIDFGIRFLGLFAPDIVVIVDADCLVAPEAIDRLARACQLCGRPVQGLYLIQARSDAGVKLRVAEFAWVIKNQVRPLGMRRLGLPCHLMGSGMAFPWQCVRSANLATGHIVEDLQLGIDMARAGAAPLFCPDALITSEFPVSRDGVLVQRTRWEHGHLSVILSEGPRLLRDSMLQLDGGLLALMLDLCVPPLALLTLLVGATWVASWLLFVFTSLYAPFVLSSISAALLFLAVICAWIKFGQHIISLGRLVFAVTYAFLKIPIYARFIFARQTAWIRSKRKGEE